MISRFKSVFMIHLIALFLPCGSIYAQVLYSPNDVPYEVFPKQAELLLRKPPPGFTSAVAWLVGMQDARSNAQGTIEADYLRLYCSTPAGTVLLAGETTNNKTGIVGGGLYSRYPYFGTDAHSALPPMNYFGETVNIPVGTMPSNVWHLWGTRSVVPAGATACWAEARYRSSGSIFLQIGVDFWKSQTAVPAPENSAGAAASNWYTSSSNWTILRTPNKEIFISQDGTDNRALWLENNAEYLTGLYLQPVSPNYRLLGCGDFNRDSSCELLYYNNTNGEVQIHYRNGNFVIKEQILAQIRDLDWEPVLISDMNNDGIDDIIWKNKMSGGIYVWFMAQDSNSFTWQRNMNATAYTIIPVSLSKLGSVKYIATVTDNNWAIVGAGDFDKSGNADILWSNKATGAIAIWYLNAANTVTSYALVGTVSDTNWVIAGVSDISGDGRPDILWFHRPSGYVAGWVMDNRSFVSAKIICIIDSTIYGWHVDGIK